MLPAFPACAAASGGLGALHTQQHMSFAAARSFTRRGCTHRGTSSRATPGASSPARHPRSQVPSASGLSPALVHFPPRFYLSPLPPLPQLPLLSPSISHGPHRRGSRAAGELSGSLRLLGVPEAGLTQPGEPGAESPIGIARDTPCSRERAREAFQRFAQAASTKFVDAQLRAMCTGRRWAQPEACVGEIR